MDNPDEDGASLQSNGTKSGRKGKLGKFGSLKKSIKWVAEKSPLSVGTRRSTSNDGEGLPSTSSPSSTGPSSPASSSRNGGGFFQNQEDNLGHAASPKSKALTRSKTEPSMSKLGDSLLKKGSSIRRSLRFGIKKENDKRMEPLEDVLVERTEGKNEREEEIPEEMDELYTLPDLPDPPLSVMEINKLIEMEVLEEAHLNLLALRLELQKEQEAGVEDCSTKVAQKQKDLSLLYRDLRSKIHEIVRDSSARPARNKGLLVPVARIIQEEEKRAGEPGGLPDSWVEAWKDAVRDSVQVKVDSVNLEPREQNVSWLAVHLGKLGNAIVEDLENVRRELRWSYPRTFKVFSTYVKSYHRVVGQHLKKLEQQSTELKDLYALLDWILNKYKSERIMGSLSLQPDMNGESTDLQLESDFLKQLKDKYVCRVKEDVRISLERVIELENESVWSVSKELEMEDDVLCSPFPMDIWTKVKSSIVNSKQLDVNLEQEVTQTCLEELQNFPKRFEEEFRRHCSAIQPQPLWTEYHVAYINSFTALQKHMDGYHGSCPRQVEAFKGEVASLTVRLMRSLEDQFKQDVKLYLRRMVTRKWLTNDDDFHQLHTRTEQLSQHCHHLQPPHAQEFASRLHYHVVREYVGQLMKKSYSCKNRKHEKAAAKISKQTGALRDLFSSMNSSMEWLHPVGEDLSTIIGLKNKADIKHHLQPLLEHYPDFSKKHLVAVLFFRGDLGRREHQLILQRLTDLKKGGSGSSCDRSRVLFGDMPVTTNTNCLPGPPFSCLSRVLPDR
uniref:Exocyst complex component 3-like 4 n=1 Tax=Oryzias latipes TaxID=8090 RepID=A0A3P9KV99_ORYLA